MTIFKKENRKPRSLTLTDSEYEQAKAWAKGHNISFSLFVSGLLEMYGEAEKAKEQNG